MQLKIMMLLSNENNKKSCECAETILQEIAGAFEHTVSLRYEKIGQLSQENYSVFLTEETVEACQKCGAVLLDNANSEGVQELYDSLDTEIVSRYCGVPQSLCGRHERGFSMWICRIHSLDEETVKRGLPTAVSCAKQQETNVLSSVSPNGKINSLWNKILDEETKKYPSMEFKPYASTEAIQKIIEIPSRIGFMIAPPYAGSIFQSAAETLNPAPFLMHDLALSDKVHVFSPAAPENILSSNPFPFALAVADLLRYSFKLDKEADCVEAAVKNVLEAGWRTPDMVSCNHEMVVNNEDIADLICEQISLAGRLMYRSNETENENTFSEIV